jgi:hypothetical protein
MFTGLISSIDLGFASQPSALYALGEELQFLYFPARAVNVMFSLSHNATVRTSPTVSERDRFTCGTTRTDDVPDFRLSLPCFDRSL